MERNWSKELTLSHVVDVVAVNNPFHFLSEDCLVPVHWFLLKSSQVCTS